MIPEKRNGPPSHIAQSPRYQEPSIRSTPKKMSEFRKPNFISIAYSEEVPAHRSRGDISFGGKAQILGAGGRFLEPY